MNRVSIIATCCLSLLGVGACGGAMPNGAVGAKGGAAGGVVVPALTDGEVIGSDADEVTETPSGQNRMHIGRPHGPTK